MGKHIITATITDKQGKILSHAQNNYNRTHPIQAYFANSVGEPSRIFLHAEIAALVKIKKSDKPYRIFISRFRKDGSSGLAKPCSVCAAALKHWGIKEIGYTL